MSRELDDLYYEETKINGRTFAVYVTADHKLIYDDDQCVRYLTPEQARELGTTLITAASIAEKK